MITKETLAACLVGYEDVCPLGHRMKELDKHLVVCDSCRGEWMIQCDQCKELQAPEYQWVATHWLDVQSAIERRYNEAHRRKVGEMDG